MRANNLLLIAGCAGLLASCATTVPKELASARASYQRASSGPAARVAPAEVHVASQALTRAEQAFENDPDSYQTRDLAYVAERKAQLAEATASIITEQKSQTRANNDYQDTQRKIVKETKQDLSQARTDLAASELSGEKTVEQLAAEKEAAAKTKETLSQTRTALANSERLGDATAVRLSAEQEARVAADKRAAEAQAALAKLAAVKEEDRGMVITLSGSVLFASNQAVLLPGAQNKLDQVSDVLLATRERNITIEGHTDSQGSDSHNLDLSQRRANAVRDYLVQRGYQADRIKASGLGEGHPIADNANAEGRANNRRVEIVIERDSHASNP